MIKSLLQQVLKKALIKKHLETAIKADRKEIRRQSADIFMGIRKRGI